MKARPTTYLTSQSINTTATCMSELQQPSLLLLKGCQGIKAVAGGKRGGAPMAGVRATNSGYIRRIAATTRNGMMLNGSMLVCCLA